MKSIFQYRTDVADQTVRLLAGLALDVDLSVGVTTSSGKVTSIVDQSGLGNTISALGGATGLTYTASDSQFNGRGSVTFNGTNDGLTANGAAASFSGSSKPMYAIVIIREVVTSNPAPFWCFSGATNGLWRFQGGAAANWSIVRRNDANTLTSSVTSVTTPNTTQSHMLEVTWDGSSLVNLWDNRTQNANNVTLASPDPCSLNALRLGANTNPQFGNFKLARALFYTNVPTPSQQALLRQLLRSIYDTP